MFWGVSRNVAGKAALIKYNWIEKTITAVAITLGYLHGDIPQRLMILIVFTNWRGYLSSYGRMLRWRD